jgi:Glycosyltransferase family 87
MADERAMRSGHHFKICLVVVAGLIGSAYLARGFFVALTYPPADVRRRWIEQQYVIRGQNPYDVAFRAEAEARGVSAPSTGRDDRADPQLGIPTDVDYPPWSYFSGYLLFWGPLGFTKAWFAGVNALALGGIGWMLWSIGRDRPRLDRLVLITSISAAASICTTIGTGNYTLIVAALLLASARAEESGRRGLAGVLLGIAQLKPNLAGPFLLVPLARRDVRSLAAASAYLVVASVTIWAATKTDPVTMCVQMVHAARKFVADGSGPLTAALMLGIPYDRAVPLIAAGCIVPCLVLLACLRHRSTFDLYAIAAVTSRFWTYHLNQSDLILLFLVLAFWRRAETEGDRRSWVMFLLVGVSLWVPRTVSDRPLVQLAEQATWLVGLAVLLRSLARSPDRALGVPVGIDESIRVHGELLLVPPDNSVQVESSCPPSPQHRRRLGHL